MILTSSIELIVLTVDVDSNFSTLFFPQKKPLYYLTGRKGQEVSLTVNIKWLALTS